MFLIIGKLPFCFHRNTPFSKAANQTAMCVSVCICASSQGFWLYHVILIPLKTEYIPECWLKKKYTKWELRVKFYLGQNEDWSPVDSTSDSSEKLLQRGRGEGQYICDFGEGGVHAIKCIYIYIYNVCVYIYIYVYIFNIFIGV